MISVLVCAEFWETPGSCSFDSKHTRPSLTWALFGDTGGASFWNDEESSSHMGMDQYLLYTIFSGMNIHLPATLMFTRGTKQGFDTLPYNAFLSCTCDWVWTLVYAVGSWVEFAPGFAWGNGPTPLKATSLDIVCWLLNMSK